MTIYPYGKLERLAEGLYLLNGAWRRSPLGRRMTVIQRSTEADNELALHSAIELDDPDFGLIDALGRVTRILVPNKYHASDASFYAERYPDARVLVPRQLEAAMRAELHRVDGVLEDGLDFGEDLEVYPIAGTKLGEVFFFHRPSHTLITTDLVFHFERGDFKGLARIFMRLNGAIDHFGITRLGKMLFVSNKQAFAESMRPVLDLDVDKVVMSHGRVLIGEGKARMAQAFAGLI